jgi:hypothetical protein
MNYESESVHDNSCIIFQELQSAFGECKSDIGRLRDDIIGVLSRFNQEILENSIGGIVSEIKIDKDTGKLDNEVSSPITFSCHYKLKNYWVTEECVTLTIYLWYKQGQLHRDGDSPAVILVGNNNTLYKEIWNDGQYKLKVPEIKTGVPHPRRPMRI